MAENRTDFPEREKSKKDLTPYAAVAVAVLSAAAIVLIMALA